MNEFFRDMLPPIHIYTKNVGRFIHTGLARLLGDDYVAEAVRLAAVEGLAECLIGRQKYRLCRHNKCPVYETRLCQCYVAFPPDDYSKCKFPELLGWLELDRLLPPNANLNFFR